MMMFQATVDRAPAGVAEVQSERPVWRAGGVTEDRYRERLPGVRSERDSAVELRVVLAGLRGFVDG